MFRFTIRDVLWLTVVVALAVVVLLERHGRQDAERQFGDALAVIRVLKHTIESTRDSSR
jgi:hypothetical protein